MNARLLARRATRPVVVALAAALSVSGCSEVSRTTEAVRINDTVIPESDVQQATRELTAEPQLKEVTSFQVAALLAYGTIADDVVKQYGKGVSDSMILQQFPQFKGASEPTMKVLRTNMVLSTNLQGGNEKFAEAFQKELDGAHLEVNPRYGTVDRSDPKRFPLQKAAVPWLKATSLADKQATGQE